MPYLRPLAYRLNEAWDACKRVRSPPPLVFQEGAALVICNPIEAYRGMFTPDMIDTMRRLIQRARASGVPVIFVRWNRYDKFLDDAIDKKGHAMLYVPIDERCILSEIARSCTPSLIVPISFVNAFAHEKFRDALRGRKRIVLAGGWTESCIRDTAKGALEENIEAAVVKDACAGHGWMHFVIGLWGVQVSVGNVFISA